MVATAKFVTSTIVNACIFNHFGLFFPYISGVQCGSAKYLRHKRIVARIYWLHFWTNATLRQCHVTLRVFTLLPANCASCELVYRKERGLLFQKAFPKILKVIFREY